MPALERRREEVNAILAFTASLDVSPRLHKSLYEKGKRGEGGGGGTGERREVKERKGEAGQRWHTALIPTLRGGRG